MIRIVCPKFFWYTFRIMPGQATKKAALLRLARRGPLRARDLDAIGVPRAYLARMVGEGLLEQIDRGLYRLADGSATELASVAEVAKRVPHVVVCLLSALQIHELTSELPSAVWVLIDRHARLPKVAYPRLEVVRASGLARTFGIERRKIEGVSVAITSPAKTVADCFRYRQHVGLEVALAALREYVRTHRSGREALVQAAKADRVYALMRPYMEATP